MPIRTGKGMKPMTSRFHIKKDGVKPAVSPRDWYRLDLSAIVYPTLQRRDFSSVYRLCFLLQKTIPNEVLQKRVKIVL